ncbi:uncharacterized protein V1518DRAFT_411636 [Limtongia smithiae]|uniref:uncharacterized protein n=1 Tax=Limtongia smithiae TaxID=1125753 RepID=UPI0034CD913E
MKFSCVPHSRLVYGSALLTQASQVYDPQTFQLVATLTGHGGSVLCLNVSLKRRLLFSGATDSILKIWHIDTLQELYTLYSVFDIGDIFAVLYSETLNTVFFGSQNASIQWCSLTAIDRHILQDTSGLPSNRFSKFFDSAGPGGKTPEQIAKSDVAVPNSLIELPYRNVVTYAHNGFVYSLQSYQPPLAAGIYPEETLLSGGGDGFVNWWVMRNGTLHKLRSFENKNSVLCMTVLDTFLYCGLTNGAIALWDLDAFQLVRTIQAHNSDILSITTYASCIFTGSATGYLRKWSRELKLGGRWKSHDGLILSILGVTGNGRAGLVTGANDDSVAIWDLADAFPTARLNGTLANDRLLEALSTFVSLKTISGLDESRAECRRCASFLKKLFSSFGAKSDLITTESQRNPIVYARFSANSPDSIGTTVLFYGHYDVIAASDSDRWDTSPYELSGLNGYLYGRGVSDNKGPVLAAVFAAAELFQEKKLKTNVLFLIEGEEESGSVGFKAAVSRNIEMICNGGGGPDAGPDIVDWILLSNSYWLDNETPCLNYGLRGVIHMTIEISSDFPDLHSGLDGGVGPEPLMDMTKLLSKLTDDEGMILVPGFYDPVKPMTEAEERLYEQITQKTSIGLTKEVLISKWRLPTLTVHGITVSGPSNQTIIPHKATATLSVRTVPEQDTEEIRTSLQKYLRACFSRLRPSSRSNHLSITLNREADAWLGDPGNAAFKILAAAVKREWGGPGGEVEPLYIREGGTIPAVRFLEKAFNAPAAQLPCGQASDHAHLDNERLRVINLYNAKNIWKTAFDELPRRAQENKL